MPEQTKSLYIDKLCWQHGVKVDDFLVAIGRKQSNSVYHVAEVLSIKPRKNGRMLRHQMKVFPSDLTTALKRDPEQNLHPFYWYSRNKKSKIKKLES